ncbi:DUF397 domain-containing protein [Micromonospora echinofusca]|uniref:DUF397 domain-containing protein n=1 Tax=Micromonospora echinofusca TaxID=47858 RepID=A0ABS3VMS4_MICEH|nr:DUF397 domain-containing protein [Micromonospora echinofusca]MBO4205838.1 DUF397 domain-containing protein [Micromonospora echinofusca]
MRPLDNTWRKSSRSNIEGSCVEVRYVNGMVEVRDSKDPSGPTLTLTPPAWNTFIAERERKLRQTAQ